MNWTVQTIAVLVVVIGTVAAILIQLLASAFGHQLDAQSAALVSRLLDIVIGAVIGGGAVIGSAKIQTMLNKKP